MELDFCEYILPSGRKCSKRKAKDGYCTQHYKIIQKKNLRDNHKESELINETSKILSFDITPLLPFPDCLSYVFRFAKGKDAWSLFSVCQIFYLEMKKIYNNPGGLVQKQFQDCLSAIIPKLHDKSIRIRIIGFGDDIHKVDWVKSLCFSAGINRVIISTKDNGIPTVSTILPEKYTNKPVGVSLRSYFIENWDISINRIQ